MSMRDDRIAAMDNGYGDFELDGQQAVALFNAWARTGADQMTREWPSGYEHRVHPIYCEGDRLRAVRLLREMADAIETEGV